MPDSFRTFFVVNPRSAGGRTARLWPSLEKLAAEHVPGSASKMTEGPGHATELARAALKEGFEMIVSVGGDGTNNEVINGFFENGAPVKAGAVFAQVPRGTGCDFARGQGIPKRPGEAFRRLAGKNTTPLDVGRIDFTRDGAPAVRYFVNIGGFGANGDVVARANRSSKRFGGFVSFLSATLASVMTYRNPRVAFRLDDGPEEQAVLQTIFVCNGRYCGGGMCAGPQAQIDDGQFDLTIVGAFTRAEAILSGRLLYSGKIYTHAKVRHARVKKLEARSLDGDVPLEADGEQPGMLPATFTILPAAVRLKIP